MNYQVRLLYNYNANVYSAGYCSECTINILDALELRLESFPSHYIYK